MHIKLESITAGIGAMICLMGKEFIVPCSPMPTIKDNGIKDSNMAKALSIHKMAQSMWGSLITVKRKGREN